MVRTGQPGLAVVAVADALSPAVIPSLIPPGKAEVPRWQAPAAPIRRPPLQRLVTAAQRRPGDPEVLVVFDAGYDLARWAFLLTGMSVEVLGRLRRSPEVLSVTHGAKPGQRGARLPELRECF
jgi:hypothetical protein